MRYLFIFLTLLISSFCYAQEHIPRCNFDSIYNELLNSDDYRQLLIYEEEAFQNFIKEKSQKSTTFTIPVVVHIVKNEEDENMNITDEQIVRQIEILNESYNLLNEDVEQTPTEFEPYIGNPQVEFCLATVDPNGYATDGITRSTTDVAIFSPSLDNIKHSELGGVDAWNTDDYLNIWVGKITSTVLGYSHTPTASIPDDEHGLVVNYEYFGETEHPHYGMGKTAVHEIGHYLNLKHPWGIGNCDANDDWVEDTPKSEGPYSGNPEHPQSSCGTVDMFMNYMDYVYDSSMVMFSQGQVDRMHFALTYYRSALQESNGCGTPLLIAEPIVTHASSEFNSDASIHLNIASGIPPFSIIWESGETTDSIVGISAGEYTVQITDSLGQELNLDFNVSYYGIVYDSDNFELYSMDSLLYTQSELWTSFCTDTFSANITNLVAPEGVQYLEINAEDGLNRIHRDLGGLDENAYDLSFRLYVPTGRAASFTIFHDSSCSGPLSAYNIQFNVDGQAYVETGGQNIPFNFPQDQWFTINQLIDLDRDLIELVVDEQYITDWTFSWSITSEVGNPRLGAIVFDDLVDSLDLVHYFIDDFKMVLSQNSDLTIYEPISNLDINLYPNPAFDKITLSRVGTKAHCKVYILNALGQVLSVKDWSSQSDMIVNLDKYNNGIYFVQVLSENAFKTLKFIVNKH